MATTKYSDISCHVEPNGIVKFNEALVTDEYSIKATAETDRYGNMIKGEWTHTENDKGVALSVTFPDGKISGRNVPASQDLQEGLRTDRGDLLERKILDCKKASNLKLF